MTWYYPEPEKKTAQKPFTRLAQSITAGNVAQQDKGRASSINSPAARIHIAD